MATDVLAGVATLLVADDHDRATLQERRAADDGRVVAEEAVPVQLDEVVEDLAGEIEGVGTLGVAGELHAIPGGRDAVRHRARPPAARDCTRRSAARGYVS